MAGTIVKDKSQSVFRWLILLFTCIMMIGNYYCYDIPAALHSQMDEYMGKTSDFETLFSLLYTVYSIPNIVLPFFGGYFIDKWGVRLCLIIFVSCISIGQFVFAFGLSIKSWPIMLLGRVIYGFGGESLGVGNSAILSVWFKGKELAFAFGLNLSIARLGSVVNNLVSPTLASNVNIQFALWFGVILCGTSVFSVLALASIDKHLDHELANGLGIHSLISNVDDSSNDEEEIVTFKKDSPNPPNSSTDRRKSTSIGSVNEVPPLSTGATFKDIANFSAIFWILALICVIVYGCVLPFNNIASSLLLERDYFKENPSNCQLTNPYQCQNSTNSPLKGVCPTKWYQPPLPLDVTLSDGTTYAPLTSSDIDCTSSFWSDGCGKDYCNALTDAQTEASTIMSIPYIISACLSPILGGFVDKFGFRAVIATIAPSMLVVVHLLLGLSTVDPIGPLVGQGLAYSGFAAVLWPSIAMVVDEKFVGLAYGIVVSIQNCGLAAFPVIIASIYTMNNDQYIPMVEVFFVICAALGATIGLSLNYCDYFYMNSLLNKPTGAVHNTIENDDNNGEGRGRGSIDKKLRNPLVVQEIIKPFEEDDDYDVQQRTRSKELFAHSMVH
eukprot:gene9922-13345_t